VTDGGADDGTPLARYAVTPTDYDDYNERFNPLISIPLTYATDYDDYDDYNVYKSFKVMTRRVERDPSSFV
jgi:hypothetical protein